MAISVVSLLVFRAYLLRWTRSQEPPDPMDTLEGEVAVLVNELDKASEPWGVKALRYEIKNISPPKDVLAAMEKQMRGSRRSAR